MSKLIWRLSSDGATGASYLFGTMHLKTLSAFQNWSILIQLIQDCDLFAAEIDLNSNSLQATNFRISSQDSLVSCLGQKHFNKARAAILKSCQIDILQFQHLPPLFLQEIISNSALSQSQDTPLDMALWQYAESQGKPSIGLETLEEQLAVIDAIPFCEQAKSIYALSRNTRQWRYQLYKMTKLYEEERLAELHQAAKRQLGQHRGLLIYDRNIKMAQRLGKLMQEQSVFAAIGAGHLWGSKGMLKLLKEQGFKIQEVSTK